MMIMTSFIWNILKKKYKQSRGIQRKKQIINFCLYSVYNSCLDRLLWASVITVRKKEKKSAEYFLRSGQRRVGSLLYEASRNILIAGRPSSGLSWQDLSAGLFSAENAKAKTWFHSAWNCRYAARASPWKKKKKNVRL